VTAIAQGITDLWEAAGGVITTLYDFLSGLVDAVWSGELFASIQEIGGNVIAAIQDGLTNAWNATTGFVATLAGKLGGLFQSLVDGRAFDGIASAGGAIVDAIMNGIQNNWDAFVEWLRGLIGGIFGVGTTSSSNIQSESGFSSSGVMTGRSGATYNLYVYTTAPISTIIQDFGMLQSLAGA
jgi:phage-related protein